MKHELCRRRLLRNIVHFYQEKRFIRIRKNKIRIEAGVPQGSVLVLLLWNLICDEILKLNLFIV